MNGDTVEKEKTFWDELPIYKHLHPTTFDEPIEAACEPDIWIRCTNGGRCEQNAFLCYLIEVELESNPYQWVATDLKTAYVNLSLSWTSVRTGKHKGKPLPNWSSLLYFDDWERFVEKATEIDPVLRKRIRHFRYLSSDRVGALTRLIEKFTEEAQASLDFMEEFTGDAGEAKSVYWLDGPRGKFKAPGMSGIPQQYKSIWMKVSERELSILAHILSRMSSHSSKRAERNQKVEEWREDDKVERERRRQEKAVERKAEKQAKSEAWRRGARGE
jgi:hypothetical protein